MSPENPLSISAIDDPEFLQTRLEDLRASQSPITLHFPELEKLFVRCMGAIEKRLPILSDTPFPIHRKNRQLARSLQKLLESLADDLLATLIDPATQTIRIPSPPVDLTLWRILQSLSRHLLTSYLSAAPAGIGIWQKLHHTYAIAQALSVAENTPKGASTSLQYLYYAAVLLGCAQPASFTSREISFVAEYLELFSDQTDPGNDTISTSPAGFWIDTTRDAPATPCSRKTAPPDTVIHYFCCDRIATLLRNQLESLEAAVMPAQLGLPDFSGTPAGRGVMHRLITYWGDPGKRRFPRRRQNYRAALCSGLSNLWQMFNTDHPTVADTSSWMITNESPDGYAVMHVSGKTGTIAVGDVTAIRTETGDSWQICIVRWALSENQEHLELGLQIIATRAVSALLATTGGNNQGEEGGHVPALLLPEVPPLRPSEMLVVPTGALDNQSGMLVLMVEKDNLEVREVRSTGRNEQNSQVEILTIEPESDSV